MHVCQVDFVQQVIDVQTNPSAQNLEVIIDSQRVSRMDILAPPGSVVRATGTDSAFLMIRPATRSQLR